MTCSARIAARAIAVAAFAWVGCAVGAVGVNVVPAVSYTLVRDATVGRQQTMDLYRPDVKGAVPLVIYLHGVLWTDNDDHQETVPRMAEFLARNGAMVAVVRYRLAPAFRFPAQIDDAAAAVSYLLRNARRLGVDKKRVFLAGHSSGAHLAALLALDPSYLARVGLKPGDFAGVIVASGLYDLPRVANVRADQRVRFERVFGTKESVLRDASPAAHVSGKGPPFLVLSAAREARVLQIDARLFEEALASAGRTVDRLIVPGADHTTVMQLGSAGNTATAWWLDFLGLRALDAKQAELRAARRAWRTPEFSTEGFWRDRKLVHEYPVDKGVYRAMLETVRDAPEVFNAWPLRRYYAVDLLEWLARQPASRVGKGEFVTATNFRGERTYWRREDLAKLKPRLVIGLDEERNLFRIAGFYRLTREYSWLPQAAPPPLMARPLGAFVYFAGAGDGSARVHAALMPESFRLVAADPLAAVRGLAKPVREVLTTRNACVSCHAIDGQGAGAHHVAAVTGKPHGGFARSLETYPTQVLWQFVFRQKDLAREFGITPNVIDPALAPPFYGWLSSLVNAGAGGRAAGQ